MDETWLINLFCPKNKTKIKRQKIQETQSRQSRRRTEWLIGLWKDSLGK